MERVELVEQIIVIGSIVALWPWVLGYREPWYQWGALALVALTMVVITVRKWRRMNQAFGDAKKAWEDPGPGAGPRLPFTPPPKTHVRSRDGRSSSPRR